MANVQDIVFILMQGFSGAVAGYITNKYAVNMIFKEYTPLKIGGAVKKNKVKFIEEVSELVERDIVNSETLIGSIESKDFSNVIDAACIDFVTNSLNDVFDGVKLKDIPKISSSSQQCVTFIEQNLQEELPKLIDNMSNKIDIKKLIQKDQLDNISEKIVKLIIEVLETDEKLEEFLSCVYDENKNEVLADFLSEGAKIKLIQGITTIINQSIENIIDDKEKCLELIEKMPKAKFDETVELHVKLGVDSKHADQQVRGTVVLPNGTGKTQKVLVFAKGPKAEEAEKAGADFVGAEELIPKIQNENWFDYDVVVATPDMMGVVGRLGKVLGPKGLMPNPKSGTVTMDVTKAINEIKSGKVEYRLDKTNIIHLGFGKVSFGADKLAENYETIMNAIIKAKPAAAKGQYIKSVSVTTTMGPGIFINQK